MSVMPKDNNSNAVQAFSLPVSGATVQLVANVASAPLAEGHYRILPTLAGTIAKGATVLPTDMPLVAGVPEHFHVTANTIITCSVAASATLM